MSLGNPCAWTVVEGAYKTYHLLSPNLAPGTSLHPPPPLPVLLSIGTVHIYAHVNLFILASPFLYMAPCFCDADVIFGEEKST